MALSTMFTASDYDTLAEVKKTLLECAEDISKAESCGLDCQARREAQTMLLQRIESYMVVLFPNGRPSR